jgi:hypothetical protein
LLEKNKLRTQSNASDQAQVKKFSLFRPNANKTTVQATRQTELCEQGRRRAFDPERPGHESVQVINNN